VKPNFLTFLTLISRQRRQPDHVIVIVPSQGFGAGLSI
jgi:hypothetical protein